MPRSRYPVFAREAEKEKRAFESVCRVQNRATIDSSDEVSRYILAQQEIGQPFNSSLSSAEPSGGLLHLLAPLPVIRQIILDWFDVIHSVCPVLHRVTFLSRLEEESKDMAYSALVVSVCAATVGSLKRKSSKYHEFVTVEKCLSVIDQMGIWGVKRPFTLERCQTIYNLAVANWAEYGTDNADAFRFYAEAVAGVKYLINYQLGSMSFTSQQLLKRLHWLLFFATCSMSLLGRPYMGMISPQDNLDLLKPLEITDPELDVLHVDPDHEWHGNHVSYIHGLNYLSKLFLLWHESQQTSNNTLKQTQVYLNLVQRALDYLPPELRWRGGLSRPPGSNFGTDVQTANLYITQLHIRSNLVEKLDTMSRNQGVGLAPFIINTERQSIVDDMLEILYQLPQEILEANGYSLVPKIRDIGFALISDVQNGKHPHGNINLDRLLAKLEELDVQPLTHSAQTSPTSIHSNHTHP